MKPERAATYLWWRVVRIPGAIHPSTKGAAEM